MEPEFVELRRRAHFANATIRQLIPELEQYVVTPSKKKLARVVTLGAGLLVELRKFGFTLAQIQSLDIVACDMDESLLVELDTVFQHDFGVPFAESGIDYRFCTIEEVLADEKLRKTTGVLLIDGVLSYCRDKQHMLEYVAGAARLVEPGGCILCDWQVMEVSLIRCALVQCWVSSMKPELTAGRAVRKAKWIARKLNMQIEYEIDPRNPRPLGVIVRYWYEVKLGCETYGRVHKSAPLLFVELKPCFKHLLVCEAGLFLLTCVFAYAIIPSKAYKEVM